MNTKINALCFGIQIVCYAMVAIGFFMEGDAALDAMIACMGTMVVLGIFFFREFFRAVRARQAAETAP